MSDNYFTPGDLNQITRLRLSVLLSNDEMTKFLRLGLFSDDKHKNISRWSPDTELPAIFHVRLLRRDKNKRNNPLKVKGRLLSGPGSFLNEVPKPLQPHRLLWKINDYIKAHLTGRRGIVIFDGLHKLEYDQVFVFSRSIQWCRGKFGLLVLSDASFMTYCMYEARSIYQEFVDSFDGFVFEENSLAHLRHKYIKPVNNNDYRSPIKLESLKKIARRPIIDHNLTMPQLEMFLNLPETRDIEEVPEESIFKFLVDLYHHGASVKYLWGLYCEMKCTRLSTGIYMDDYFVFAKYLEDQINAKLN